MYRYKFYKPFPFKVWSPRGPVPNDPVVFAVRVQSKSSSKPSLLTWDHLQRPPSKEQLLSDGVIVVGGSVGGMEPLGNGGQGLKPELKLISSKAMSPWYPWMTASNTS